jgi:hypothetical protein
MWRYAIITASSYHKTIRVNYLQKETIAGFLFNGRFDTKRVRHCQVVTDNLNAAQFGEVGPGIPIILVEGVLDRNDRVLLNVTEVEVGKLYASDPLAWIRVGVLEVQIVFALLVKFRGSDVQSNLDLPLIARFLDSLGQELERFFSTRNVGSEATLVTDIDGCNKYVVISLARRY